MSIKALNWAWDQRAGSPAAKAVLVALADFADELHSCWPSMALLAYRSEVSERTVKRVLADLVEIGLLRRERRYIGYGKRSNDRYVLPVEAPFEMSDPSLGANLAPNGEEETKPQVSTLGANLAPNDETVPPLGANCGTYIENPEKIDKSIFIESEPSAEAAARPDRDISEIDVRLGKIHPSLSVQAISQRLKVAQIADVDVLRAVQTLLGRASQTVHNPVAFVATGIDRAPEAWRPLLPGFEPGDDVSGRISVREVRQAQKRAQKAACDAGSHDWGPTVWPEVDRGHCLACGVARRTVDPVFRELQDDHDRFKFGQEGL